MKIDERAFRDAAAMLTPANRMQFQDLLKAYLAALPQEPAEKGRDRIAVVVGLDECEAMVLDGERMNDAGWEWLEERCGNGPFVRVLILCNLPRPPEPVEVEGSVEVVGA